MADRRVKVTFTAEIAQFRSAIKAASESTEELSRRAKESGDQTAKQAQAIKQLEKPLLGMGAAAVAGLGLASKAAIDWESAWAGVTKTVDGSPEEMAALEKELRNLATTLPATHEEIAGVAEAAGQLGVAREDVADFTRTMIDLSETTNLTADEAATSIAQMMNVMQTAPDDVDNLGAALVALGNDGASTEKDILMMSQRLAGTGRVVGATEADVLAMANAMASVGISAELGGGAMSRVMQDIFKEVKSGGDNLEGFAEVAGMTASEYAAAFESDPMRATDAFIKGLGGISASGGDVISTLSDLGIKSTEETRTLLSLAGAGDLLTESLDLGAKAWEENSALAEEAQKRYETTEAKIQTAWNTIKDAAISAGEVLLPLLADGAEAVSNLVGMFNDLPAPVQGALTVITGLAGATALGVGGFIKFAPMVREAKDTLRDLAPAGTRAGRALDRVSTGMGKIAKAGAAVGVITAVGVGIAKFAEDQDTKKIPETTEHIARALAKIAEEGPGAASALDAAFKNVEGEGISKSITDLDSAISTLFEGGFENEAERWVQGLIRSFTPLKGTTGIAEDAFKGIDAELANMVNSGNADGAATAMGVVEQKLKDAGVSAEEAAYLFPQYSDALYRTKEESDGAAAAQEVLDAAIEETGVSVEGVIESMDKFLEQLFQSGLITMSSRDAQAAYQEQLDSVDDAVKEVTESSGKMGETLNKNKTDFDLTSEAGRLANSTFQGLARDGMAEVEALAKEGVGQDELQGKLSRTYEDLLGVAGQFGLTGGAAETLARKVLGVPDDVDIDTWMSTYARDMAGQTQTAVNNIPGYKEVTVNYVMKRTGISPDGVPAGGFINSFPGRAAGGAITGPGTGTSDTAGLFALSNGEHVLTAAEVQAMGGQDSVYRFRASLKSGVRGYADGGAVGAPSYTAATMFTAPQASKVINVEYNSSNAVKESESKVIETSSQHLSMIGGI